MVDSTEGIDRNRFEVRPAIVRPLLGLAPLQSFLGFGLGGLLLVGSVATTRQRRTVYAAIASRSCSWGWSRRHCRCT